MKECAIASLALGVVGLIFGLWPVSLAAVVLGYVGYKGGDKASKVFSWIGILLGLYILFTFGKLYYQTVQQRNLRSRIEEAASYMGLDTEGESTGQIVDEVDSAIDDVLKNMNE